MIISYRFSIIIIIITVIDSLSMFTCIDTSINYVVPSTVTSVPASPTGVTTNLLTSSAGYYHFTQHCQILIYDVVHCTERFGGNQ